MATILQICGSFKFKFVRSLLGRGAYFRSAQIFMPLLELHLGAQDTRVSCTKIDVDGSIIDAFCYVFHVVYCTLTFCCCIDDCVVM